MCLGARPPDGRAPSSSSSHASPSSLCRIFTLYSKSLPLDLACRVWDVFCRDGEEFLFRTALGLLRLYQDVLTCMDFIHMAQFLTRLPDLIPAEQLFQHIAAVHMTSRNRKWPQVRAMARVASPMSACPQLMLPTVCSGTAGATERPRSREPGAEALNSPWKVLLMTSPVRHHVAGPSTWCERTTRPY